MTLTVRHRDCVPPHLGDLYPVADDVSAFGDFVGKANREEGLQRRARLGTGGVRGVLPITQTPFLLLLTLDRRVVLTLVRLNTCWELQWSRLHG